MEKLVEALCITLFKATHDLNLQNMNRRVCNFPAIDLADFSNRVAVQVTTNATARKVNQTIKMFKKHKLDADFDRLIVIGFCNASPPKAMPQFCEVIGMDEMTSLLISGSSKENIESAINSVRQHHDYSKIHPYDDINCLEMVLGCIDKNAIKHLSCCEGDYGDMVTGLNEISELISKGQIRDRSRSKAVDDFLNQDIKDFLRTVRDKISQILVVINRRKRHPDNLVCLFQHDMTEIDNLKKDIVCLSNQVSSKFKIPITMVNYGV